MGLFCNRRLRYMAWKPQWQVCPRRALRTFTIGWTDTKNSVTGAQRKGNLCYVVAKSLAKLSPIVTGKIERAFNSLAVMAKDISRQNIKSINMFHLL